MTIEELYDWAKENDMTKATITIDAENAMKFSDSLEFYSPELPMIYYKGLVPEYSEVWI